MEKGTLYIVSTPIGNLGDITFRAVETLKTVNFIIAEDTRRTKVLLKAYDIETPMKSFHSYNIARKAEGIINELQKGANVAIVSDSGTPGISDPGFTFFLQCIEKKIPLIAVPGPTAMVTALVVSGKPMHSFVFEGFLSNKTARRKKQLAKLAEEDRTVILYESPHRIVKFLEDFDEMLGAREVVIARELTKKFEEIIRGQAKDIAEHFKVNKPKGEFVVIF